MKKILTPALYVGVGLILGFILALYLQTGSTGLSIPDYFVPQSCVYNGTTYANGEGFLDTDGCNTCSCSGGVVACTLMYCEPNEALNEE